MSIEIFNEDCLEKMKDIEDKSIDLILCDLPYGTTDCKWDIIIDFEKLWEQYKRIIKDNGAIVLFGSEPFSSNLRLSNKKMYRYDWYWKKNNVSCGIVARIQPMRCIETISVFYKKTPTYNPQGLILLDKPIINKPCEYDKIYRKKKNNSVQKYVNYPNHFLEFRAENCAGRLHPSQKPVELLEYLIKTYTNEGDLVLDNCMGSGSTGVACINLNRKFIGIEKEEKYYKIAEDRTKEAFIKKYKGCNIE